MVGDNLSGESIFAVPVVEELHCKFFTSDVCASGDEVEVCTEVVSDGSNAVETFIIGELADEIDYNSITTGNRSWEGMEGACWLHGAGLVALTVVAGWNVH